MDTAEEPAGKRRRRRMKRDEDEEEGWEEPYPNQDGNDRNAWLQVALPACVCVWDHLPAEM